MKQKNRGEKGYRKRREIKGREKEDRYMREKRRHKKERKG